MERVMSEKELRHHRLSDLERWFDDYFSKQFQQSQWQDDFVVSQDPYFKDYNGNPLIYSNIEELKIQAKLVRDEIRQLRNYE